MPTAASDEYWAFRLWVDGLLEDITTSSNSPVCTGATDAMIHFPSNDDERNDLIGRTCGACPHSFKCLAWAVVKDEKEGIWGGTTPHEREVLVGWFKQTYDRRSWDENDTKDFPSRLALALREI